MNMETKGYHQTKKISFNATTTTTKNDYEGDVSKVRMYIINVTSYL